MVSYKVTINGLLRLLLVQIFPYLTSVHTGISIRIIYINIFTYAVNCCVERINTPVRWQRVSHDVLNINKDSRSRCFWVYEWSRQDNRFGKDSQIQQSTQLGSSQSENNILDCSTPDVEIWSRTIVAIVHNIFIQLGIVYNINSGRSQKFYAILFFLPLHRKKTEQVRSLIEIKELLSTLSIIDILHRRKLYDDGTEH